MLLMALSHSSGVVYEKAAGFKNVLLCGNVTSLYACLIVKRNKDLCLGFAHSMLIAKFLEGYRHRF